MKVPDLTPAVNFFVKLLNGVISIFTFLFRIPILGIFVIIVVTGMYYYFKAKQKQE